MTQRQPGRHRGAGYGVLRNRKRPDRFVIARAKTVASVLNMHDGTQPLVGLDGGQKCRSFAACDHFCNRPLYLPTSEVFASTTPPVARGNAFWLDSIDLQSNVHNKDAKGLLHPSSVPNVYLRSQF